MMPEITRQLFLFLVLLLILKVLWCSSRLKVLRSTFTISRVIALAKYKDNRLGVITFYVIVTINIDIVRVMNLIFQALIVGGDWKWDALVWVTEGVKECEAATSPGINIGRLQLEQKGSCGTKIMNTYAEEEVVRRMLKSIVISLLYEQCWILINSWKRWMGC